MSQGDIARALDVDKGYISNIENGKKNPTLSTLTRLAQALGVGVDDLIKQIMPIFNDLNLDNWKESEIWTDSLWIIPERDKTGKHNGFYPGYSKKARWQVPHFSDSYSQAFVLA